MSRHRNIRNMDIDDYYDDYYDDYDDYYDDDEYYDDDYAYTAPKKSNSKSNTNKNKNNNQAKAKAKPSTATKTKVSTSSSSASKPSSKTTATTTTGANPFTVVSKKQNIQAITTGTGTKTKTTAANNKNNDNIIIREEKMGLITAMGFSTDQAKRALEKSNGDVESAINILLVPSSDNNSDATVSAAAPASSSLPVTTPSSVISKQSSQPKQQQQQQQESKDYLARQEILKQFNSSSNKSKNKSNSNSNNRSKLSMVVLGHVDAGKSTLVGQLLLKLGYVDKRQIQKYEKQANDLYNGKSSFALAWVMDENESERERGVTMEVGTKHVQIENHDLTILDSPGHADFIPSMITGAASADVGLLVVAATPGEFEDGFASGSHNNSNSQQQQQQYNHQLTGQTREHVILARGLGVNQLIVAVNKLDMSQPTKWNQQRFKDIQQQLKPFLKASGFNLKRVKFVPVSSFYGINFLLSKKSSSSTSTSTEKDHENMLRKWYTGPTLIEAMNQFIPAQRNLEKPLRFIVNDVSPEGKGRLLIRGKVVQGFIRTFDKIIILPISDEATVNRVMTNNNESDGSSSNDGIAFAGENAEISINGVDVARVSPGVIICHSSITTYYEHSIKDSILVPLRNKFTAQIVVMDDLSVPIIRGANMILHMHSIDVPAVMTKLISTNKMNGKSNNNNKNNNTTTTTIATGAAALKKRPPRVITGGSTAHVEITTSEKLCVEEFNKCRALGRFVLRRGGDTIAVGIIETLMDSKKKKTGYYY